MKADEFQEESPDETWAPYVKNMTFKDAIHVEKRSSFGLEHPCVQERV